MEEWNDGFNNTQFFIRIFYPYPLFQYSNIPIGEQKIKHETMVKFWGAQL